MKQTNRGWSWIMLIAVVLLGMGWVPSTQATGLPMRDPDSNKTNGWTTNPSIPGSGWVAAQVVGGGCDGAGHCNGNTTPPNAPVLYEYTPDREPHDQVNDLSINLSQHGGDRTAHAREICSIGGTQIGWAAGMWHHGATWIQNQNGTWSGPLDPHWVYFHGDECFRPQPSATPTPTATPQPGQITVQVFACGQPFGTRITREDTGEGYGGVSAATFTVPSGHVIRFKASGYGGFVDSFGTGSAPGVVRIAMEPAPGQTPCAAATPPPSGPTPTPPPVGVPCVPTSDPNLQALRLATPAGSAADPVMVPAGPLNLRWNADGVRGDRTGTTAIAVYDVTSGSRQELLRSIWVRPFDGDTAQSSLFAKGVQANVTNLSTSQSNAWRWNAGWLQFATPALVAGHTYELYTNFVQGYSCASFATSAFVRVGSPDIQIRVRRATMTGLDTGPITNRVVQVDGQIIGQTSDQGTLVYHRPTALGATAVAVRVVTPPDEFTWTLTGTCLTQPGATVDLATHTVTGLTTGGCDLVWTQVAIPPVSGRAFFRNAHSGSYQSLSAGRLVLVAADGTLILSHALTSGDLTTLPLSAAVLRPLVGPASTAWSLSFTPPEPIWTQTPPVAGSAGDSMAGDLSITFPPVPSVDNRFFIERESTTPVHLLTLRGSVRLITREGTTQSGPYGTVKAQWTQYSTISAAVAADGSWVIQIPNLAYSPTITLSFQKNLATAVYDHAEPGTVGGQPMGVATAPNRIGSIVIGNDGSGEGYAFVLRELPPPPPPPVTSGDVRIWIHSHLDPEQGVYRSTTQEIAWPHAEILDVAPAVTLKPLPVAPAGYRYEQRVVAWAYDGSIGTEARERDVFSRTGCRSGDVPPMTAGDLSLLTGCVYAYHEDPTATEMGRQARLWWSMVLPTAMHGEVYSYQIPRFQSVDLALSVLVETAVIDTTTGQRWTQRQVMDGSFVVNLVAPRTLK